MVLNIYCKNGRLQQNYSGLAAPHLLRNSDRNLCAAYEPLPIHVHASSSHGKTVLGAVREQNQDMRRLFTGGRKNIR